MKGRIEEKFINESHWRVQGGPFYWPEFEWEEKKLFEGRIKDLKRVHTSFDRYKRTKEVFVGERRIASSVYSSVHYRADFGGEIVSYQIWVFNDDGGNQTVGLIKEAYNFDDLLDVFPSRKKDLFTTFWR